MIHDESMIMESEFERWREIPVTIAVDLDLLPGQIDPAIRPLLPAGKQPPLFGRAFTVRCDPPDFGSVLHALDLIAPGEVMVIAASGHRLHAMIGEVLSGHLRSRGVAGLVCDGAIRDVATLASWSDFPVYSRSITPRGPIGVERGDVAIPVSIGGVEIAPGDLIIGDSDGLVALDPEAIRNGYPRASAKLALEATWIAGLAAGKSAHEVFGLPGRFA